MSKEQLSFAQLAELLGALCHQSKRRSPRWPSADLAIALAYPARETIINLLEDGTTTMGDLTQQLGLCPPSTTHHIDTLERVGLVRRCRRGGVVFVEATCIPEIVLHPIAAEPMRETARS